MSTLRRAFAVIFISAAVAAPVFVAGPTLGDDPQRSGSEVSPPACGNGKVQPSCDTSGETGTCNADCTVAFCGDGKVNFSRGESCDTGGPSATCNVFCQAPVCGNGAIEGPFEQCDDGNTINNDSCTNQCQFNCGL
jgi:cysteine-rich repeat protein